MPINLPTDQKALLALIDRRHPRYAEQIAHWEFCRATHDGGRAWFAANVFKYVKEGPLEFQERLERAYRFNHTKEVVRLVTKYIFKSGVIRNRAEAPRELRRFWRRTTAKGAGIDTFMRRVCDLTSISGRTWVVVDSRMPDGVVSRAEETLAAEAGQASLFAYTVTPENMLDYAWDDAGELLWAMWRISHRDDEDPVASSGQVVPRYAIWTRDAWVVLEENVIRGKRQVSLVSAGENPIGVVPCFAVDEQESDDPYDVPALIGDIAYLDRAIANYLSNLDAIIQDQTFSQLAMPAQGLLPGEEAHTKMLELGTKRVFTYDGEAGAAPAYISPDPKQASVILVVVNKIIGEIYHSIGMAGERTKQDNAVGIDNSSGVAKAYDFERVNSLLAAKADVLERAEDRINRLAALWLGVDLPKDDDGDDLDLVKYPDSFDVRSLYDEFEIANHLSLLDAPDELRREQMRQLVAKLLPRHAKTILDAIEADVKAWPPKLDLAGEGLGTAPPGMPQAKSRQGQVTADTTDKKLTRKTAQKAGGNT